MVLFSNNDDDISIITTIHEYLDFRLIVNIITYELLWIIIVSIHGK
jgi:hypothetical protein